MDSTDKQNENKNFCLNLDDNESDRLSFIMHEIHGAISSIDNAMSKIAGLDFSKWENQQTAKELALDSLNCSSDLRMMLDFWQVSNSRNYFDNAVARPQALWSKFYYLNSYFKSIIRQKQIEYIVLPEPQPGLYKRSPVADYVGYPIINAIANILIDNAIKYSPSGDSIVCEFEDEHDCLTISIENNGPYILPEEIDKLYLCGMRGKNADKADVNGHGYGMNFLKLIVDAHGGEITITSSHDYTLNGIPYGKYRCVISLPKYTEDEYNGDDEYDEDYIDDDL